MRAPRYPRVSPDRLHRLRPAPGELSLLQAFLNSADLEAGTDELAGPPGLGDWLERHALLPAGEGLAHGDGQLAIECRESLRKLVAAGTSASRELGAAVDRTLVSALLCARFEAGGELSFAPANAGLGGALGRLLATVATAQRDGLWPRFKICASATCRAAFYDYSTNRSALWCAPNCGGRVRGRDFRQRKKRSGLRW